MVPTQRVFSQATFVLVALVLLAGCRPGPTVNGTTAQEEAMMDSEPEDVMLLVEGEPLSESQIEAVYARLPSVPGFETDAVEFAMRSTSLKAPKTGQTVQGEFPPPDARTGAPGAAVEGPLEVLRFQPEGEIPRPNRVSVTFSHPMVDVTSHADALKQNQPVKLVPEPQGMWRWIGTKTIVFEPAEDFPMATEYTLSVEKGARSAVGTTLEEPLQESFSTAPLTLQSVYPSGGPHPLDPVIVLTFDQRVDPEAISEFIEFSGGRVTQSHRLATEAELEEDEGAHAFMVRQKDRPWVAIKATRELPASSTISVGLKAGAPSAEGPRPTAQAQTRTFRTYGPFSLTRQQCYGGCRPQTPFSFTFTNPIAPGLDLSEFVKVSPSIPELNVSYSHSSLTVRGRTSPSTTYTVEISRDLRDRFGQRLDRAVKVDFAVGNHPPSLTGGGQSLVTLDPYAAKPSYSIFSVNFPELRVRIHRVTPDDWSAYNEYLSQSRYLRQGQEEPPIPGIAIQTPGIRVQGADGELVETAIDLSGAMGAGGLGHAIVVVEAPAKDDRHYYRPRVVRWVQSTQIGIDAYRGPEDLRVWATSLKDGKPIKGADVQIAGQSTKVGTGEEGLATLKVGAGVGSYLVVRNGADEALLPENLHWHRANRGWSAPHQSDWVSWFVVDDRQMYKPGEEVRLKGWARLLKASPKGGIEGLGSSRTVAYKVFDPRRNEIAGGEATVNSFGGFDLRFEVPDDANLGHARVQLSLQPGGGTHSHSFQIQEFRRPEYEVKAESDPGPHLVGERAEAWVQAAYYAGGALPDADVNWSITHNVGYYSPPKWPGFVFGNYRPWWWSRGSSTPQSRSESQAGKTDVEGVHRIEFQPRALEGEPRPQTITATATVTDVNRQAWSSTTNLLVHPAEHYVGLRTKRWFFEKGKPIEIEAIVSDIDGKAVTGRPITVTAHRVRSVQKSGQWTTEEVDPQECKASSAGEPVKCSFETPEGGQYRVVASIEDEQGRKNQSSFTIWVSGGKQPPKRNVEQESITLIPDQEEYNVGDTAEVLIQVPFAPAEVLVTLRRHGFYNQERVTVTDGSHTLKVPINEDMLPNVHLHVDAVGPSPRVDSQGNVDPSLPPRPAFAKGALNLKISTHSRKLTVDVAPRQSLIPPGSQAQFDVDVKDDKGAPVQGAEVLLFAVDEAVLALSSYRMGDPMGAFYSTRVSAVNDFRGRQYVLLNDPASIEPEAAPEPEPEAGAMPAPRRMAKTRSAPGAAPVAEMAMADDSFGAAGNGAGGDASVIAVRENFDALAFFEPTLRTNAQGRTTIDVKIPDNLTRYRIMAVAVHGDSRFGTGESNMTARLPLMVRPSPPRFLNFGDKMELPVVLQNQTERDMNVHVVVRGQNLKWPGARGMKVRVPAQNRVEVRFPAETDQAGIARIHVGASAGEWADAAQLEFPVWTPATTEAFATYGTIEDGSVIQPVKLPGEVFEQFGNLEVTTSSTQLQALTDAFIYLVSYPYGCAEQIASRVLSVVALRDVLSAFKAEGMPSPEAIDAMVARDLQRLSELQNHDGGFGFWRRGEESWPYSTAHVAHALVRAKDKGYEVPQHTLNRVQPYLRNIEQRVPAIYGQQTRDAIQSFGLFVRMIMGDQDTAAARKLVNDRGVDKLTMESLGWLMSVMAKDPASTKELDLIYRHLNNQVDESAATAEFASSYGNYGYYVLNSARRTDAVILEGLLRARPENDLIPKVVRGLLGHRVAGRWGNTQENVFILLALDRYFHTYEATTPNFVARAWLGDGLAGEHAFRGRTTEQHHVDIPLAYLAKLDGGKSTLVIDKDGAGRMYYRIGMRYAPRDLKLGPADHGFAVERRYEAVDDPEDVRRLDDGTWQIAPGATVRITITMATSARRYHVALVDAIPAGLEPLNPALATTANIPQDPAQMSRGGRWWWWGPWYQHQNLRDERAEAFATILWGGVHSYTYYARATTPGEFVVPPAKAEEMYHPETFGRSGSDRVIVR